MTKEVGEWRDNRPKIPAVRRHTPRTQPEIRNPKSEIGRGRHRVLRRYTLTLASWVGLAWVYSAALWLTAVVWAAYQGWLPGVGVLTLRFAASLAVGVGLCATERRAWAAAVGVSTLHLALALALGAAAIGRLTTLSPTTLSWMTVFFGLTPELVYRVAYACVLLAVIATASLVVLWRAQHEFDVPDRRPFSILVREGAFAAVMVIAVDAMLVGVLWRALAR